MVTEDYVSWQVAKMLAEKGFDLLHFYGDWYTDFDNVEDEEDNPEGMIRITEYHYPLITIQRTEKWLRKHYKVQVNPYPLSLGWYFEILDLTQCDTTGCAYLYNVGIPSKDQVFESHYSAAEAGIVYTLKNLERYD